MYAEDKSIEAENFMFTRCDKCKKLSQNEKKYRDWVMKQTVKTCKSAQNFLRRLFAVTINRKNKDVS